MNTKFSEHCAVGINRIVHDVGVILTGEEIAGPTHISGELINFVEVSINGLPTIRAISQICYDEIVRRSLGKLRIL